MSGRRAVAAQPQVPAGEDARRGVDVVFGVVADADGEELHQLAAEVLLRPGAHVEAAVEPHEHRRVLGHLDQQLVEAAQAQVAEELHLPAALAGHFRALPSIILVPCSAPNVPATLL